MSALLTRYRRPGWRAVAGLAAAGCLVVAMVLGVTNAFAATLLSDDFEDGNASGWTTSGGSWSVTTDGSRVYRQGGTSADARARAGSTSWTNYAVSARVKPTAFNGADRFVAVLARVQSNTNYYYLALGNTNRLELRKLVSGSSTTLASTAFTVSTGTWYTLSLQVSGSTLRGTVNGGTALTATDTRFAAGQIGVATFFSAANVDDVLVTDSAPPTPTATPPTTTPPTATPTATPTVTPTSNPNPQPNVADGYAAMNALGQNGTSGGAGGSTVTVSTASAFLSAIATPGPLIIRVSGTIALPGPMHDVTPDKTIVGVGANSGFTGGGLNIGLPIDNGITSPPPNAVHNVIIRNLNFNDWPDDAMNIQMFSHHVWIDHNTWGTGSDGSVDIKRGSSYVTVSWNHAVGSNKNMLLGRDDADAAQDTGRLLVTYHHNWFDQTRQRNPRVRYGDPVHVFNNYYFNIGDYGIAATIGSGVLVEGNYFEDVDDPYHLAEGDSPGGSLVARDNCLVGTTNPGETGGSVKPIPYAYSAAPCSGVKASVTAGAGAGRIGL